MKKVVLGFLIGLGLTAAAAAADYAIANYKGQMEGKGASAGEHTFFVYDLRTDKDLKDRNFTEADAAALKQLAESKLCENKGQGILLNAMKPMYVYVTDKQLIFISLKCPTE